MLSNKDVLQHDGKNNYGSWRIEWLSKDVDPEFGERMKKMSEIERKCLPVSLSGRKDANAVSQSTFQTYKRSEEVLRTCDQQGLIIRLH